MLSGLVVLVLGVLRMGVRADEAGRPPGTAAGCARS